MKSTVGYTTSERSDILFYLLYGTVATTLRKTDIVPNDIKEMNINNISEEEINKVKEKIYKEYKRQGGNSHVAKSSSFISDVKKYLS